MTRKQAEEITESFPTKKEAQDRFFALEMEGYLMSKIREEKDGFSFAYISEDKGSYEGFKRV